MSSNSNGNAGDETQAVDETNSSTPGGTANNHSNNSYHTNSNNNCIQSQHIMNTQQLLQQLPTNQENITNSLLPHLFGTKYDSFVDDNDNADNVNYLNALYANSSTGNGEDMDFPLFLWDMDEGTGASTGGTTGTGGRSTPAAAPQATTNQGSGFDSISTMSKLLPSQSSSNVGNNQANNQGAQSQPQLQVGNPLNTNTNSSMNMNLLNFNMNVPQSQSGVATNFSAQSFVNDLANQLASAAGGAGSTTGTNTSCGNPLVNANALQPLHQFNLGNFQLTFDNSNLQQQQQQHPGVGGLLATAPALQQGGYNNNSNNNNTAAAASTTNPLFGLQGNTAQPWNNVRTAAGTNSAAGSSNNNNSTSSIPQHHQFVNQIANVPKVDNRAPGSSSSGHSSTVNNNFQQQQQNNINQLLGSLNPQIMNSLGFSQNRNNSGGRSNNFNQQQQQEQDQVQKFQLLQQQLYNQRNLMFPPPPQQHQQQQQQQFQIRMTSPSSNQQQQNSNNQNAFIPSGANNQQGTTTPNNVPDKQKSHQQQNQQRAGTNTTTTNSSSKRRKLGDNESLPLTTTTNGSTTTVSNNDKTHAVVSCSDTDGEQVTITHASTVRSSNTSNAVATSKKQRNVAAVSSASVSRSGVTNNGNNITTKESSISSISSNSRHSDPKTAKATDNGNNHSGSSSGGGEEEEEDESNIPSLSKSEDLMSEEEKAQANRLRNREHARNTRARKKAYLESLKSTLDELCKERDTLVSERAGAASLLLEMQKTRTDVLLSFFALRSSYEKRRQTWSSILDESIMCVMPVTPYRSFLASEVQISRCQRNVMGIDGVINDTASLHVLLNSLVDRSKNPYAAMKFRYTLIAEDAVVSGNQMMARWSMSTENAIELGAKREVTKAGMLCAKFSSAHKIVHLELMFDVMAFMLQLKQSSGVRTFTMVPNTVQTCVGHFGDKPMLMTLAERPYTITQVNSAWEKMTSWTGDEVVGKQSCKILQGDDTEANAVKALMCHVRYQRTASASFINYDRHGRKFRQFINIYPLSTDSKITHYFALTVYYEKILSNEESEAASKTIQNTKNDDVELKEESSTSDNLKDGNT